MPSSLPIRLPPSVLTSPLPLSPPLPHPLTLPPFLPLSLLLLPLLLCPTLLPGRVKPDRGRAALHCLPLLLGAAEGGRLVGGGRRQRRGRRLPRHHCTQRSAGGGHSHQRRAGGGGNGGGGRQWTAGQRIFPSLLPLPLIPLLPLLLLSPRRRFAGAVSSPRADRLPARVVSGVEHRGPRPAVPRADGAAADPRPALADARHSRWRPAPLHGHAGAAVVPAPRVDVGDVERVGVRVLHHRPAHPLHAPPRPLRLGAGARRHRRRAGGGGHPTRGAHSRPQRSAGHRPTGDVRLP